MSDRITALRLCRDERIDPLDPRGALTRNLELAEVELPEPGPGELLVAPLFAGVCGSDNSACLGKDNFAWVQRPRTLGHEFSARVEALGPGTEAAGLRVGDLVCALSMRGCGDRRCRGCRRGRWNYCRRKQIYGFHRDGALGARAVIEADRCLPLRPGITPLQGAVIEPLSVVTQAIVRKCAIQPGQDVVVSGCGIIGMMAAELARAAGARVAVTGVERDREVRLKLAEERGFTTIVVGAGAPLHERLASGVEARDGTRFGDDFDDGLCDLLIECSGAPPALGDAGLAVQPEGTICVIATYPCAVPFAATAFTRSGQTLRAVMGSSAEDYDNAQILLSRGTFPVEAYAQVYPFADALRAMDDSIAARTPKAVMSIQP